MADDCIDFSDQTLGLLQPSEFRLGLLENWDVGVGVFPEDEEVLVGSFRFGGDRCRVQAALSRVRTRRIQGARRPLVLIHSGDVSVGYSPESDHLNL